MKSLKVSRRVTVTAQEDSRDRLLVSITVDDSPVNVTPSRHGDAQPKDSPVPKRAKKSRRGGSIRKLQP